MSLGNVPGATHGLSFNMNKKKDTPSRPAKPARPARPRKEASTSRTHIRKAFRDLEPVATEPPAPDLNEMVIQPRKKERKLDLAGKKKKLIDWIAADKIPGKSQAWLSVTQNQFSGDWRLISETRGAHRMFMLEAPATGVRPPNCILAMDEQLRKEHLKPLRRQLLQVLFRATGDGRYGILMHAILRTPDASRALKTWMDYLQRTHPEVLCCHVVQTKPWFPFDPSNPPIAMKYTLKQGFGSEFIPIASTGLYHHILDWAPRNKSSWLAWPERLKAALHPVPGDRLLACHSGPSFEALSMASSFANVHCLDSRQWAQASWTHNIHAAGISNSHFYQDKLEEKWIQKFFEPTERKGKWTILLNPPGAEPMPATVITALAQAKPERIVHVISYLDIATKEIRRWRRAGYILRKLLPLDWNPESSQFEVALVFVPDRAGLLGRKSEVDAMATPIKPREVPSQPTLRFVQSKTRKHSGKV